MPPWPEGHVREVRADEPPPPLSAQLVRGMVTLQLHTTCSLHSFLITLGEYFESAIRNIHQDVNLCDLAYR